MLRCYITDRRQLPSREALLEAIARNFVAGVDWIQIRERDLSARDLFDLVRNARVDVARAAGAAGAHLPSGSPPPRRWRAITPPEFLIGVSCHTIEEARAAERDGADYVLFGPVFTPRSKSADLPPRGLDRLTEAARAVRIPVLALGGITKENALQCVSAGAAGVAAISLFQTC